MEINHNSSNSKCEEEHNHQIISVNSKPPNEDQNSEEGDDDDDDEQDEMRDLNESHQNSGGVIMESNNSITNPSYGNNPIQLQQHTQISTQGLNSAQMNGVRIGLKNLIGRIFLTEKDMLDTIQSIFPKGIKVCRKDKWKNGPNAGLHKKWRFVCECSGQPKPMGGGTPQMRKSKKIGCPFYVNAFWSKDVIGPRITTANFYHYGHDGNDIPVYHFSEDSGDSLLSQYETIEQCADDPTRQQMQKEMLMLSLKSKLVGHLSYLFANFPLEGIVRKVHDFLSPETNPPGMFSQPISLNNTSHHLHQRQQLLPQQQQQQQMLMAQQAYHSAHQMPAPHTAINPQQIQQQTHMHNQQQIQGKVQGSGQGQGQGSSPHFHNVITHAHQPQLRSQIIHQQQGLQHLSPQQQQQLLQAHLHPHLQLQYAPAGHLIGGPRGLPAHLTDPAQAEHLGFYTQGYTQRPSNNPTHVQYIKQQMQTQTQAQQHHQLQQQQLQQQHHHQHQQHHHQQQSQIIPIRDPGSMDPSSNSTTGKRKIHPTEGGRGESSQEEPSRKMDGQKEISTSQNYDSRNHEEDEDEENDED